MKMSILPRSSYCSYSLLPCLQEEKDDKKASGQTTSSTTRNDFLDSSSSSNSSSLSSQQSLTPDFSPVTTSSPAPTTAPQHYCAAVFRGHSSYVFSLCLSDKSGLLFSGSYDNQIRTWRPPQSLLLLKPLADPHDKDGSNSSSTIVFDCHSYPSDHAAVETGGAVKAMVVSGNKLFTAHQDHKIRVWRADDHNAQNDADSNQPTALHHVTTLPTLKDCLLSLFSAPNGSTLSLPVRLRRRRACPLAWGPGHLDTVSALALSKDGTHLYSASWDRTVKVWRTSDLRCVDSIADAHDDAVNAVAVATDGRVFTGSADKKIKIWRRELVPSLKKTKHSYSLVATLEKHRSAVNALAVTEDEEEVVLYSAASDRTILVWESQRKKGEGEGEEEEEMVSVGALRGHEKAVLCLAVMGSGRRGGGEVVLCSGSADKTVRVWRRSGDEGTAGVKRRSYTCLAVLRGHARPVKCTVILQAAEDCDRRGGDGEVTKKDSGRACGYLVYSGGLDCDIRLWKIWDPS